MGDTASSEGDLTTLDVLKLEQLAWAAEASKRVDGRGYLPTVRSNLFQPLHEQTRTEFQRASGGELRAQGSRPAKMRALHSSAVLVCNVFDYWRDRDKRLLTLALGLPHSVHRISFEVQLPTGLGGTPPNLDLLFELRTGDRVVVESKFTECYSEKPAAKPFKAKYFPRGKQLWASMGLPHCQDLAEAMHRNEVAFSLLDAAQLLKQALGAAIAFGVRGKLLYLFFDSDGQEGSHHRAEVQRFMDMLNAELSFDAISYQAVLGRMLPLLPADAGAYRDYLRHRYLRHNTVERMGVSRGRA